MEEVSPICTSTCQYCIQFIGAAKILTLLRRHRHARMGVVIQLLLWPDFIHILPLEYIKFVELVTPLT